MKRIFSAVYALVLVTQLPHVAAAYAGLERAGWYQWTAWAAAVAFEASIAAFTYRIVVERSRRRTTRLGLAFFLVASAVANATYYGLAPAVFAVAMPLFATVALPLSLSLFASEFGAEVNREERKAARLQQSQNVTETVTERDEPKAEPAQPDGWTFQTFRETYPAMLEMTGKQIAEVAQVSERTGNNWKRRARNGHGEVA